MCDEVWEEAHNEGYDTGYKAGYRTANYVALQYAEQIEHLKDTRDIQREEIKQLQAELLLAKEAVAAFHAADNDKALEKVCKSVLPKDFNRGESKVV